MGSEWRAANDFEHWSVEVISGSGLFGATPRGQQQPEFVSGGMLKRPVQIHQQAGGLHVIKPLQLSGE